MVAISASRAALHSHLNISLARVDVGVDEADLAEAQVHEFRANLGPVADHDPDKTVWPQGVLGHLRDLGQDQIFHLASVGVEIFFKHYIVSTIGIKLLLKKEVKALRFQKNIFVAGGSWTIQIPGMVMLAEFKNRIVQERPFIVLAPAAGIGASILRKPENVWTNLLPGLILGILISAYRSGTTAHSPWDATLRIVFAAVLIWTGMRYFRTKRQRETAKA